MRRPLAWKYVVTVRTIGGVLQQMEVEAESSWEAHQKVKYEWPDRKVVRIARADE